MKQSTRLIIALVVLFGIVGIFILYLSWPFLTGKTIVLATRPVDPFDIFRGQYITINYEIGNIPAIPEVEEGSAVYVLLEPDEEGIWRFQEVSLTQPREGTFIRGEIMSIHGDNMRIKYGIEQYFFERHASLPTRGLTVEVKVSSSGQVRISNLLHDGKPVEIEYKNISITS